MHKSFSRWRIAALAVALSAPACFPANGQQASPPDNRLGPDAMSASDKAVLLSRQNDLVQAARIYGFTLDSGNWSYEQALCPPMEGTIMLHYFQHYPDGTDSLFTALVPRKAGRIRIVPVLYHNTTPYTPAPRNQRNYAVFNELESGSGGTSGDWLELSACYAELTGAPADLALGGSQRIGIAGAPLPTVHLNVLDQSTRVTFASRENPHAYKVWNISFNHHGRVIAAAIEDFSVPSGTESSKSQPAAAAEIKPPEHTNEKAGRRRTISQENLNSQKREDASAASANRIPSLEPSALPPTAKRQTGQTVTNSAPAPPAAIASSTVEPASNQSSEAGWKLILHPPDPPVKFVPEAPDPTMKSSPADPQQ